MIKYYVNYHSCKIHMVANFPKPKGNGFTHCGQPVGKFIRCSGKLTRVIPFTLCERCRVLVGSGR